MKSCDITIIIHIIDFLYELEKRKIVKLVIDRTSQ